MMIRAVCLVTFMLWAEASRPTCHDNFEVQYPVPSLCGNGVLDPGELCDDGNHVNNDGCDSTCSFFDAFAPPCTLAGRSATCPYGSLVTSTTRNPTKTIFCNLKALSIHPLGKYLILADNNVLVKYNLFTDDVQNVLSLPTINSVHRFDPLCSIKVLEDSSVLTYECTTSHKVGLVSPSLNSYASLFQLPSLAPTLERKTSISPKFLVIPDPNRLVLAGVSKKANETSIIAEFRVCVEVFMMDLPSSFSSVSGSNMGRSADPWVTIPCVVYNAVEQDNTRYLTYDMTSMTPIFVLYESCIQTYMLNQMCVVVHMQNSNLQRVAAYIPENGGVDIHYTVHSNTFMDNALGVPIRKYSHSKDVLYTLRGSCFQAEQLVSRDSRLFVQRSLGSVCDKISSNSNNGDCITPLNNPFVTDILTSQNLLPEGLVSSNTHWELSQIFSTLECNSSSAPTLSGALYYKTILESVYGNTVPVDFEENPYTKDIFYITQTTLGMIGTKRFNLMDSRNMGYCKATNVIACPPNSYGYVEVGVCYPCNSTTSPGYGSSVAWQIKCALKELKSQKLSSIPPSVVSNSHQPTMESYSNFVSRSITDMDLHASICLLMKVLNRTCPVSLDIISREQHNAAADEIEFQSPSKNPSLIKCLIEKTERKFNIDITNDENAEYIAKWIVTGTEIIDSLSIDFGNFFTTFVPKNGLANLEYQGKKLSQNETDVLSKCFYNKNVNKLGYWLRCSIPYMAQQRLGPPPGNRRRLLQTQTTTNVFIVENNALSLISSTPVIFNPTPSVEQDTVVAYKSPASNADSFPLWTGVGVGIAGAVVVIVLLFCIYNRKSRKRD